MIYISDDGNINCVIYISNDGNINWTRLAEKLQTIVQTIGPGKAKTMTISGQVAASGPGPLTSALGVQTVGLLDRSC